MHAARHKPSVISVAASLLAEAEAARRRAIEWQLDAVAQRLSLSGSSSGSIHHSQAKVDLRCVVNCHSIPTTSSTVSAAKKDLRLADTMILTLFGVF